MKLLLFSSVTFRTFCQSLALFFAFFLHYLESQIDAYVRSHHAYKDIWTPEIGKNLNAQIEPNNPVGKYAVCIRKSGKVVGHLNKGATDKFAKAILFFLRADPYSKAKTITSGGRCNLSNGEGLKFSCKLELVGHRKFIDLLQDELIKMLKSLN